MIRTFAYTRTYEQKILSEDYSKDLFISACGYQHFMTKDYSIKRPNGRDDYQLLYLYSGTGDFYLNGAWQTMPAGSIILYRPHEPQIHNYYAQENPEIYWIHFVGADSSSFIEEYQIQNTCIGKHRTLKHLFDEIIIELQLHKPMFHQIAVSDFQKLLALVNRFMQAQEQTASGNDQIDHLLVRLNKHYMEPWDIKKMADFCHLSTDYFSHQFKQATGSSPISFLNHLRIEHAKEMLLTENLTVSEISELVGYHDPLYFSRIFKKISGISPKMYHGEQVYHQQHNDESYR